MLVSLQLLLLLLFLRALRRLTQTQTTLILQRLLSASPLQWWTWLLSYASLSQAWQRSQAQQQWLAMTTLLL